MQYNYKNMTSNYTITSDAGGGTAVPDNIGLVEIGLVVEFSAPGTTSPNSFISDKYWINTT